MSTAPYVEPPAYRSVIRLLNLYCLFHIVYFAWNMLPLLDYFKYEMEEPLIQFLPLLLLPAMLIAMLVANLARTPAAHVVRLAILGFWIAQGFYYLPGTIGSGEVFYIITSFISTVCDVLFFFFLLRRHRPRIQMVQIENAES